MVQPSYSETWHVYEDGSGDAPTIQAAIDSASAGDDVLIHPGVYSDLHPDPWGDWNTIITMKDSIWIHSSDGPEVTILDAQDQGRVVVCWAEYAGNISSEAVVEGLTLTHGREGGYGAPGGGAINVEGSPSPDLCTPVFKGLHIVENNALSGAALEILFASPTISGCWIEGNFSSIDIIGTFDGTLTFRQNVVVNNTCSDFPLFRFHSNTAFIEGNTFAFNESGSYGGIIEHTGSGTYKNNIIAFNVGSGNASLEHLECSCNDVYGNLIDFGPFGVDGHISADPQFCDPDNGDFTLTASSPCLPGHHPDNTDCGLIGALPIGCPISSVPTPAPIPTTWGLLKLNSRENKR
ncbi:MAG: DUF5123 domain-containing protein [Candidatus Eisenbacteria bacterium]|uniref:DUF5123 domain-containing protein n=1 Tax=Eiseniibacteriota bacterium TaxID=2212470 RepID=A0A948W2B5_UNCEI|nr:DUF5123 domain-containing protein [Candidatus Eisenbacteria bacterium]